jgi:hypothetical protein
MSRMDPPRVVAARWAVGLAIVLACCQRAPTADTASPWRDWIRHVAHGVELPSDTTRRPALVPVSAHRAGDDEADETGENDSDLDLDDGAEDDENEDDEKVEQIIQELFLGFVVYPQDRREIQLSTGYFRNFTAGSGNWTLPNEIEYGLTDHFQIGFELPVESIRDNEFHGHGLGIAEITPYWNFYSDRRTGRACGVGCNFGLPPREEIGPRAFVYEPFFVAYRRFPRCAVNLSMFLEVADPIEGGRSADVSGEVALAVFQPFHFPRGQLVPIFESTVEIEAEETTVRLAPAAFWQPKRGIGRKMEIGVSWPITLGEEEVEAGVFALLIVEFGGDEDERETSEMARGKAVRSASRGLAGKR